MFGLPLETTLLVIGFLYVSRNWGKDTATEDDQS
jgi:hypothetical protein